MEVHFGVKTLIAGEVVELQTLALPILLVVGPLVTHLSIVLVVK
jgi:hypothetical protein